ncbi:MAG: nucleotidyl transferase AbiEii/AbiGii toxin family protein [Solobacterium sp.]|nr:nucleotidyl transferase AbiEii/AbiGii toxin family protein [Solobacterium sp.]
MLMLSELAEKQKNGLPAFFKGGTALYKALKTTNRFSEDIDLSVDTRGCSRSQNAKRLDSAAKKYTALNRDISAGRTNRSEVISIFTYDPVTVFDADDALQRFGKLKIEATSFTISEPTANLEIAPMLYDLASPGEQKILREQYEVFPFSIMTITMERIFIDKLFAAEAYVRRSADPHRAFEAAKHIYDLAVMIRRPEIRNLLANESQIRKLLDIRITEEAGRLDGIPGVMPMQFTFFETAAGDSAVRKAYAIMQAQYVLRAQDRIEYDTAVTALSEILDRLMQNRAWTLYNPDSELLQYIQERENERHS